MVAISDGQKKRIAKQFLKNTCQTKSNVRSFKYARGSDALGQHMNAVMVVFCDGQEKHIAKQFFQTLSDRIKRQRSQTCTWQPGLVRANEYRNGCVYMKGFICIHTYMQIFIHKHAYSLHDVRVQRARRSYHAFICQISIHVYTCIYICT